MVEGDGQRFRVDIMDPHHVGLSTHQARDVLEPFDGVSLLEVMTADTESGA
jgi:hypothetical protein